MLPIGWLMILIIWGYISLVYKPEKSRIEGLKERVDFLISKQGKFTKNEIITLIVVLGSIGLLVVRSFVPQLKFLDKSAIMLLPTILLFLFNILKVKDLEDVPWNIILLFGGAMCIGFALWQTGGGKLVGCELACLVQKLAVACFYSVHSFACFDFNKFHNECCSDCYYFANFFGNWKILWSSPRSYSFCFVGNCWNAFSHANWGCSKCNCLRKQTVYQRRILPQRNCYEYYSNGSTYHFRGGYLAIDGNACFG